MLDDALENWCVPRIELPFSGGVVTARTVVPDDADTFVCQVSEFT